MKEEKKSSKLESIIEIFFGVLWFAMSALVLSLYMTDSLGPSIPVPKIFLLFYDILGIVPGALVQIVLSIAMIGHGVFTLIKKRKESKTQQLELKKYEIGLSELEIQHQKQLEKFIQVLKKVLSERK